MQLYVNSDSCIFFLRPLFRNQFSFLYVHAGIRIFCFSLLLKNKLPEKNCQFEEKGSFCLTSVSWRWMTYYAAHRSNGNNSFFKKSVSARDPPVQNKNFFLIFFLFFVKRKFYTNRFFNQIQKIYAEKKNLKFKAEIKFSLIARQCCFTSIKIIYYFNWIKGKQVKNIFSLIFYRTFFGRGIKKLSIKKTSFV